MRKLSISIGLVAILVSGAASGYYVPLTSDTSNTLEITNTVSVSYTNEGGGGTVRTAARTNDVDSIWGIQASTNTTAVVYEMRQIAPGGIEYFSFLVHNAGNTNAYLEVTNLWARWGGAYTGNWATNELWLDVDGGGTVTAGDDLLTGNGTNELLLTEDATLYFVYKLKAATTATDTRALTNYFTVTNERGLGNFSTYTGILPFGAAIDTNYRYGGLQWYSKQLSCVVGGPNLIVTKMVTISNSHSYTNIMGASSGNTKVVPGTKLIYTITVTNAGSGIATDLIVSDLIPSNTVYVSNSMAWGDWSSTYLNATYLSDDAADDPAGTVGLPEGYYGGSSVEFTFWNGGGTAMPARYNAEARRKLYFQVIVK